MADKKISALTGATTPLAGTEVLPIVQSGSTVKVAVSDLTTGRAVSASSFSATGSVSAGGASGAVYVAPSGSAVSIPNGLSLSTGYGVSYLYSKNSSGTAVDLYLSCANWQMNANQYTFKNQADTSTYVTFASDGNVTLHNGNIIQGTAAKGVNFTANTPAAGMTSQLLNWYEEGTFTATAVPDTGTITLSTNTLRYTRTGRTVHISGTLVVDSVSSPTNNVYVATLPFSAGLACGGGIAVDGTNAFAGQVGWFINAGQQSLYIYYRDATGAYVASAPIFKAGTVIRIDATYTV